MRRRRRSRSSRFSNQLIALFFMLLLTFAVGYLSLLLSEPVAGPFRAQDGDSLLSASGQSLRLEGVDAPEYRQMCDRGGVSYPCGRETAAQLPRLVRGAGVECDGCGFDRYERILVRCRRGDMDINEQMVSGGCLWRLLRRRSGGARGEARILGWLVRSYARMAGNPLPGR